MALRATMDLACDGPNDARSCSERVTVNVVIPTGMHVTAVPAWYEPARAVNPPAGWIIRNGRVLCPRCLARWPLPSP